METVELPVELLVVVVTIVAGVLVGGALLVAASVGGAARGAEVREFVAPPRAMMLACDVVGAVHVALGLVAWLVLPGGSVALVLVGLAAGCFYVMLGHAASLVTLGGRLRRARQRS